MRPNALGLLVAACLAPSGAEAAKGVLHTVERDGESYAEIAERYYGQRYLGHHLRVVNRHPEPLSRGRTIVIPTARDRKLRRGQSLEAFAARHLGASSRAGYLRLLHRLGPDAPAPGQRLTVPPSLRHRVGPEETLRSIARTYYRDSSARRLDLLRAYNRLRGDEVPAGRALRLPLDTAPFDHRAVRARQRTPPPPRAATPPAAPTAPTPTRRVRVRPKVDGAREARAAAEAVERLYGDGRYLEAHAAAARALEDAPAKSEATVTLWLVSGSALVALGRPDEARAAFARLLAVDPDFRVDPQRTSPKIIEVFEAARRR